MMSPDHLLASVSRETRLRLEVYVSLLKKWNRTINLVSTTSIKDVWNRHVVDSAQLLEIADVTVKSWADMGSGGGLPGLVVAILAADRLPNLKISLIEADQRKCAFLLTVKQALALEVTIVPERIETCLPMNCDVISARALAPLDRLLSYSAIHLKKDGKSLFLKGRSYRSEIDEAQKNWNFVLTTHPSATDANSVVLEISKISHV